MVGAQIRRQVEVRRAVGIGGVAIESLAQFAQPPRHAQGEACENARGRNLPTDAVAMAEEVLLDRGEIVPCGFPFTREIVDHAPAHHGQANGVGIRRPPRQHLGLG